MTEERSMIRMALYRNAQQTADQKAAMASKARRNLSPELQDKGPDLL